MSCSSLVYSVFLVVFFFFKQKTAYEVRISDWSSDVCSSDLYQAKALLAKFGVAVPRGGVAFTPDEAVAAAGKLGGPVWVVKAQIHAGGRGKGDRKSTRLNSSH